jgi:DNA repair protein RadC
VCANAAALIVAHNHPSGDPSPSPEDINVTRQLVKAGSLLDIKVLDHVIIGHQRYVSMKERQLVNFDL